MKTISSLAPLLLLIFACRLCSLSGNTVNPNDLNPYKGSVKDLLPKELSVGLVKYKLDTSQTTHFKGATEAVQANYTMEAGSISVQIQLVVANFSSSQDVEAAMQAAAKEKNATLEQKTKNAMTVGQRFTDENGRAIIWSNGSLICIVRSTASGTTSNFEGALPF
jgi:post-segregation antitoxin (ccd killing protein)